MPAGSTESEWIILGLGRYEKGFLDFGCERLAKRRGEDFLWGKTPVCADKTGGDLMRMLSAMHKQQVRIFLEVTKQILCLCCCLYRIARITIEKKLKIFEKKLFDRFELGLKWSWFFYFLIIFNFYLINYFIFCLMLSRPLLDDSLSLSLSFSRSSPLSISSPLSLSSPSLALSLFLSHLFTFTLSF